jgi:DNA repair protein RecO (recombination protein O)
MPSNSERALVLGKTKLGETDLIITAINTQGAIIKFVAKGARKPGSRLGSSLELFMVSDVLVAQGRNLGIATEARIAASNQACRADFEVTTCASVICELTEKLTRDADPDQRNFDLAVEALRCLGIVTGSAQRLIAAAAAFKLTAFAGFMPMPESCIIDGRKLDYDSIKSLLYTHLADLQELTDPKYNPSAQNLLRDLQIYLAAHLELRLKSLEILLSTI